jgi:hypothetical protein
MGFNRRKLEDQRREAANKEDLREGGAGKRASTAELSGDRVPKTAYPPLAFILILRIKGAEDESSGLWRSRF